MNFKSNAYFCKVSKIRWNNHELHEYCFKFLFDKFKEHYLPEIFPGLNRNNSIYEPCLGEFLALLFWFTDVDSCWSMKLHEVGDVSSAEDFW